VKGGGKMQGGEGREEKLKGGGTRRPMKGRSGYGNKAQTLDCKDREKWRMK